MNSNECSLKQAADIISSAGRIAVFTHENPDGDAVGSSAGLALFLKMCGKTVQLFFAAEPPEIYREFIKTDFSVNLNQDELLSQFDLIIQLDTATRKRIATPPGIELSSSMPLLVIDHHVDNERYGRWNVVEDNAATAGIITKLIKIINGNAGIEPPVASLLMLGLVTDTGCFRFDNTTPEALCTAGMLMADGAEYKAIIERIFFSKPLNRIKFESELLASHLNILCNGKVALVKIPQTVIEKYNIVMADTEGLIDVFRAIDGVEITIMMYYRNGRTLKVSTRASNPEHPVGPIARAIGGGGHEMAAGCLIHDGDIDAVADKIIDLIKEKYHL